MAFDATAILGSWKSDVERGGFTLAVTETFEADGTYALRGHVCDSSECIMLDVKGLWSLLEGCLEVSITESNAPEFFEVGLGWSDKLVGVADSRLSYVDGYDGEEYAKERVA